MTDPLVISFSNEIYKVKDLQNWFDENWKNYIEISDNWKCRKCPQDLPCICESPDWQSKFLKLYKAIDVLLRRHRLEKYCAQQLVELEESLASEENLKIWIHKNEKIVTEDLITFDWEYLEHDQADKCLRIFGDNEVMMGVVNAIRSQLGRDPKTSLDYEVLVDINDFEKIIKYIQVSSPLYFED